MTLYVLDTDHITLHQRNHPAVVERMKGISPESTAVTVITVEEQLRGRLAQIGRSEVNFSVSYRQLHATIEYFCNLIILDFDALAQRQYEQLHSQRIRIGTLDLRIAAIVLAQNAILVTRNRQDFQKIPGLYFEDWSLPL